MMPRPDRSMAPRLLIVGVVGGMAGLVISNLVSRALSGWGGLIGDVVLVPVAMLGALLGLCAGVGGAAGRVIGLKLNPSVIAEGAGAAIGAFVAVFVVGVLVSGLQQYAVGSAVICAATGAALMALTVGLDVRRRGRGSVPNVAVIRE